MVKSEAVREMVGTDTFCTDGRTDRRAGGAELPAAGRL